MKYHVFNPITGQYHYDLCEADAIDTRNTDLLIRVAKSADDIATEKARKREDEVAYTAAQSVWPEATYRYTTYNMDTDKDLADVFQGPLGLIKIIDGQVAEVYFQRAEFNNVRREYVTYKNNSEFEYYQITNVGTLQKIDCNSGQLLATTHFEPLPLNNIFKKGEVIAWSVKSYGFIIEYIKPLKVKDTQYDIDRAEAEAKLITKYSHEHTIVAVTMNEDGTETWSSYP